jgi:hypothetical protein
MDPNTLISIAATNYRLTPNDLEISEWDRQAPINDVPATEVIVSLHDEAGPCWKRHPDRRIECTCRVVVMRIRSLDAVLYMQHTHPVTNMSLRTDRDVSDAMSHLQLVTLPQLSANQPRLQQALAGALQVRFSRQLPAVGQARLGVVALISEISEREWCAGWHLEAEHRVWAMIAEDYKGGLGFIHADEAAALRGAARTLGAWPLDRDSWVPMDLWLRMHADWVARSQAAEVG